MFTPLLITGKDLQNSLLAIIPDLDIAHPDRIWFNKDEQVIDVESLRSLDDHFLLPPYQSSQKILIVHRLDLASETVQNMLLKKLEEPPEWLQLYITSIHIHSLLPTVLSRVQLQQSHSATNQLITDISSTQQPNHLTTFNISINEKIKIAEQLKDRNQAIDTVLSLLQEHVELLQTQPSVKVIENIRRLTKTLTLLHANTNVRLSVEWCLFGLHKLESLSPQGRDSPD